MKRKKKSEVRPVLVLDGLSEIDWPMAADAASVEGRLLLTLLTDDPPHTKPTQEMDLAVLRVCRRQRARFPNLKLTTANWLPFPDHWPKTSAFLKKVGHDVAIPPWLEPLWDQLAARLKG